MLKVDRRDFLKTSGFAGIGILSPGKAWCLTKLELIGDTLREEYPYRGWEDIYRAEYAYDQIGYAAHCVNCQGNCAFKVLVKDGIVIREEQRGDKIEGKYGSKSICRTLKLSGYIHGKGEQNHHGTQSVGQPGSGRTQAEGDDV